MTAETNFQNSADTLELARAARNIKTQAAVNVNTISTVISSDPFFCFDFY